MMSKIDRKIKGILYSIENRQNSKLYIGVTTRTLRHRWKQHLHAASRGLGSEGSLQSAIRKFGAHAFECKELSKHDSLRALSDAEIAAIAHYETLSPRGYNLNSGGSINFRYGPYNLEGFTYFSLESISENYGILPVTLHKRMQSGRWTIEQACGLHEPPRDYRSNSKPINVSGMNFRSMLEACEFHNVDQRTVDLRINRLGWSIDEAFGAVNRTKFTISNLQFKTLRDACSHFQMNEKKVDSRLRRGWSLEEAFECVERRAQSNVAKATTARNRIKSISFRGEMYPSLSKLASAFSIKSETLCYRLRSGWTIEQALGFEEKPQNNFKLPFYKIGAEEFSTEELCKKYDINISTFRARKKRGWKLAECLGIEPAPSRATAIYIVTKPNGEEIEVRNWNEFAKDENLPAKGRELRTLATTKRKIYAWNGWRCRKK